MTGEMIKKLILTSAFSIILTAGSYAATPSAIQTQKQSGNVIETEMTVQDYETENDNVEVSQTSDTDAQKLKQAEKAENIKEKDSYGGAITIMSMCIVLLALIVLSLLFMCFGKVSSSIHTKKKKEVSAASEDEEHEPDSGEVIAAIAMALDEHFGGKHDIENTILTLKRMKRAYSPWNSKIYNMRELPQLKKRR